MNVIGVHSLIGFNGSYCSFQVVWQAFMEVIGVFKGIFIISVIV